MKKYIYLLAFSVFTVIVSAQTPGGVAGSVLWLKGNGASPSSWTDNSGTGNSFSQATGGNQPALAANVFNFNAALVFNGTTSYMTNPTPTGFPVANDSRTAFVVAKGSGTVGYQWIFVYGTPGCAPCGATYQLGSNAAGLTNAFYGPELTSPNYWNAAANLNGAMASFTLDAGTATEYNRGQLLATNFIGPLTATSVNGVIGALVDGTPQELWNGSIGEVIMFPSLLTAADRNKVESYLALKYGFTLGNTAAPQNYTASDGTTVYWTASATYQNDIFGIGKDATGAGLTQVQSNSMNTGNGDGTGQSAKANMVVSTGATLADNQFLLIGNDAAALTETTIGVGQGPVIAEGSTRVLRNWKVQNTGGTGAVDISIDLLGLVLAGGVLPSNYRLMIDEDGDGDYFTGTQTFVRPAAALTGTSLSFAGVTLANNAVFTLITLRSVALPALWQGFTATLQQNTASLTWKTSNEINVDHYTVEYSADGLNFIAAGNIAAKNGTGVNTYTLLQNNLPAGTRYYRIKRVDQDGNFVYSEVRSVRTGSAASVILKSNPIATGNLELNIDVEQNQQAIIRIVSLDGKILVQQRTGLTAGVNATTTNLVHVAPGAYLLQVQLSNEMIIKKIIKR